MSSSGSFSSPNAREQLLLESWQAQLPDNVKVWLATAPGTQHHTSVRLCGSPDRVELICKPHHQCVN